MKRRADLSNDAPTDIYDLERIFVAAQWKPDLSVCKCVCARSNSFTWMSMMLCQLGQKCVMEVLLLTILSWVSVWAEEKIIFDRHAVYWNSSNPKWVSVQVNQIVHVFVFEICPPIFANNGKHVRQTLEILKENQKNNIFWTFSSVCILQ